MKPIALAITLGCTFAARSYCADKIPLGIIFQEPKPIFRKKISYLDEGPALVDRQWNSSDAEAFIEEFI